MIVPAVDTDIANLMFYTDLDGDMVAVNLSIPASAWDKNKEKILNIAKTLRLKKF